MVEFHENLKVEKIFWAFDRKVPPQKIENDTNDRGREKDKLVQTSVIGRRTDSPIRPTLTFRKF